MPYCCNCCTLYMTLCRYNVALIAAQSKPVVRKQALLHLMEWLKLQVDHVEAEHFEVIKVSVNFRNDCGDAGWLVPYYILNVANFGLQTGILLGLTDVWSAIRSACVSKLAHIIEHFGLDQLCSFFTQLVQVCQSPDSSWQAKEGAIMGEIH